jgi:hypothetical protein
MLFYFSFNTVMGPRVFALKRNTERSPGTHWYCFHCLYRSKKPSNMHSFMHVQDIPNERTYYSNLKLGFNGSPFFPLLVNVNVRDGLMEKVPFFLGVNLSFRKHVECILLTVVNFIRKKIPCIVLEKIS